jgi:hypothetical protein
MRHLLMRGITTIRTRPLPAYHVILNGIFPDYSALAWKFKLGGGPSTAIYRSPHDQPWGHSAQSGVEMVTL